MTKERKVFVIIGVVVLIFIFCLPALIKFIHPYMYVDKDKSNNKKDEVVENTNKPQTNPDNEENKKVSITQVTKESGQVKCSFTDTNELFTITLSDTITYENYKIKSVKLENNIVYKNIEEIASKDEIEKGVEQENKSWVGVDGITVNSSFDANTSTVSTVIEMELNKGNSFKNSDGFITYSVDYAFNNDINEILSGNTYSGSFCEEI